MLGLPKSTELSQALPKTRIFAKFELRSTQKERFDDDISRLTIVNEISQRKVPALHPGKEVKSIYVLEIQLKRKDYDPKNIQMLSKLIPQNILFLLRYDDQAQLAIYHTKLLMSDWGAEPELVISGLDMDAVWENIVKTVGTIEVEEGNTLAEQITIDDEKAKLKLQIEQLEEKSRKEKQPRKKLEMFEEIQRLKLKIKQI